MKKRLKAFSVILLKIFLYFFGISILSTIIFRFVPIPFTPLMITRCVEQKMDGKAMKLDKDWVPLEEISPNLQLAVVCSEDQQFLNHFGFDFDAIEKAYKFNKKKKKSKPIKGASTISQQVAKNVFLWQGRSWLRKGFEVYFTLLIETIWSKERIMEVYLNVIEMGDGIYGAQAAAKTFYKKDAKKLSMGEAATIAACLPNPRKWTPRNPSNYIYKKQKWILRQMANQGGRIDYDAKSEESESKN